MIPVQVHLVLNHVPLVGLVFGLIFSVLGMKRSSPQFYLAGFAHFLGYGCDRHSDCAFRPAICGRPLRIVLAECNRSGSSPTGWNADSSCSPGIVGCKRDNTVQITSGRVRTAVLVIASVGLGLVLWTSSLGASSDTPNLSLKVLVSNHQPSIELTSARREG